MNEHVLIGLDGQNPLGFLAAIGLLRVLDDDAELRGRPRPSIGYRSSGELYPVLRSELSEDELVELVLEDARRQGDNQALQLAYTDEGKLAPPSDRTATRDLKPTEEVARDFLQRCARRPAREAGLAAAWFSELIADRGGTSRKPTALHFTAGQQTFLAMVDALRTGISAVDVREALFGPWLNASTLPSLTWDSSVARNYALRARNPSGEKRGSVPAANWLGVVALEVFPVVPRRDRLETTAVTGGWKNSVMRWPLWTGALTFRAVSSLMRVDARQWTAAQREALGIVQVYGAKIQRSEQGGYGSFLPAHVVLSAQ